MALAMEKAQKELSKQSQGKKDVENLVYVVSDGVETCGGDPVKAAEMLHGSDIQAVVNIIGFDVDDSGQQALRAVADAAEGEFTTVDSEEDLESYMEQQYLDLWFAWGSWGTENWFDVDKQYWNKYRKLSEKFNDGGTFDRKAVQERERLKDAAKYLEEKKRVSYEVWFEVDDKIYDRYRTIDQEFRGKIFHEKDKVMEGKRDQLQQAIDKKTEEMQQKYD